MVFSFINRLNNTILNRLYTSNLFYVQSLVYSNTRRIFLFWINFLNNPQHAPSIAREADCGREIWIEITKAWSKTPDCCSFLQRSNAH